jgi:proteasome lid subunit RPN8/RPN11
MGEEHPDINQDSDSNDDIRNKIKKQLRQELLEEIYQELKQEENEPLNTKTNAEQKSEIKGMMKESIVQANNIETRNISSLKKEGNAKSKKESQSKEANFISTKTILKIASHALKYANKSIPKDKWIEVIGLLAGKIEGNALSIEDAFPMGHGNAVHAEVKDYKNYSKAFNDIRKQKYFICGWYHSHPTYGLFLSTEDLDTQSRYQKLWDKSIALVMDPYMIDGSSYGFEIFKSVGRKYYPVPYKLKGAITPLELQELLEFINPIVDGKALYLEYDEEK